MERKIEARDTARIEMRKLLLGVVAIFTLFQVISYLSISFGMLMIFRIGVACSHSIFWSIISIIAVRIVPDSHKSVALSMIVTGSSIAMILGLPTKFPSMFITKAILDSVWLSS